MKIIGLSIVMVAAMSGCASLLGTSQTQVTVAGGAIGAILGNS